MKKSKMFVGIMVVIALILATLSVVVPLDWMNAVILATRFFEVMIPVLAVASLLKYLCCAPFCKTCDPDKTDNV